jgi:quercetin dioxygenase-like cupin family protein
MTSKLARAIAVVVVAGVAGSLVLEGQAAPAVKRSVVLKEDTAVADREGVMATVELPPGSSEGPHTHFADVFAFVLEGAMSLEVEGKPTATVKAGDVFHIPAGKVHQGINNGSATVKMAVVFFAEKGKPLTTPVK